ncbi:hypothetical protein ACF0H5_007459 [Mactra antiquata]
MFALRKCTAFQRLVTVTYLFILFESTKCNSTITTVTPSSSDTSTDTSTVVPLETTTKPPTLGDSCNSSDNNPCSTVAGAVCLNDMCTCSDTYFQVNESTCLLESDLKPQNLSITEVTENSLTIYWNVTDTVASVNLTFNVNATRSLDPTKSTACIVPAKTLKGECSGLEPGVKYNVTVQVAFTPNGGNTIMKEHFKEDSLYPSPPGQLWSNQTLKAPDVMLKWTPSQGRVDKYLINIIVTNDGTEIMNKSTTNNSASIPVPGLSVGTKYNVTLYAISYSKRSTESRDSFRTITEVPEPPGNLILTFSGTTNISSVWPATDKPNGDIYGYLVCYQTKVYNDSEYDAQSCVNVTGGRTFFKSDLSPGTFFMLKVYTINDLYISDDFISNTTRTLQSEPGKVSHLTLRPGDTFIDISWQRPTEPNGDIVAYKVVWSKLGGIEESVCLTSPDYSPDPNNATVKCEGNDTINYTTTDPIISYQLKDLDSYTKYIVNVTAYTIIGPGDTESESVETNISAPNSVSNVTGHVLNSTAVNVTWEVPEVYPGPVNYSVVVYDGVFKNKSSQFCEIENYTTSNCIISGLEEFWKYMFGVRAETRTGLSEEVNSTEIVTDEDNPSGVKSYTVLLFNETGDCNATKVNITWIEPDLLYRNSNITKYAFVKNGHSLDFYETRPSAVDPYETASKSFFEVFYVTAETRFEWKIYAVGKSNIKGEETEIVFRTGSCAPPVWTKTELSEVKSSHLSISTVVITLPKKLFQNTQQGNIRSKGLIVAPVGSNNYGRRLNLDIEKVENWKNSSLNGFDRMYKIELSDKDLLNNEYAIGADENCGSSANDVFCNGRLPSSWTFKLAIYYCTQPKKCTSSGYIAGSFRTATPPPPEESSKGWIIAVAILVVLAAAVAALGFLWFRGIIDPKKWFGKDKDDEDEPPLTTLEKKIVKHRPIKVADYFNVLEDMHRDTNLVFSDQYDDISKLGDIIKETSTTNAAKLESNTAKNRWVNILPFDHSRVKLQQIDDDDPTSDYINANYMPGFNNQREYIATQGPLPGTVDDFWRLVWEQDVRVIVMLTQCKEGNKVKCEKYWPDELREPKQYGDVVVNPVSISQLDKYNISIFYVTVNNSTHQVIHFHYLDFPDFSANVEFDHFIEFVRTVRNHVPHDMTGPMIVHCSAGVGRTGTFITVDRLQLYLNSPEFSENDEIDIFNMVLSLRQNRVYMVQTESQFIMIHDCFEKMLADKKAALQVTGSMENLYSNQAFDAYPEVLYENVEMSNQRTEL